MDQSYEYESRCRHFPLFYVLSLFAITFLMIHFIQYNSEDKIPSFENFKTVAKNQDPTPESLPIYDYNTLPNCDLHEEVRKPRLNLTDVGTKFRRCAFPLLARFFTNPEGLMFNWQTSVSVCDDEPSIRDIQLRDIGADSWAVLPTCKEDNVLVTLGVRNNTTAEENLLNKIPDLKRFGTDPFVKNSRVYNNFYSFALSEGAEEITLKVTENGKQVNKTVPSKGIKGFLQNDLKLRKIDMIWINPTYGNFPFWDYLHLDGEFRKMGIVVCQMMIDMPKEMGEQWVQMIQPMEKDTRYIFMRPKTLKNGSTRTFFLNVDSPQCTRKYLE